MEKEEEQIKMKNIKGVGALDPKSLIQLLEVATELRKLFENGKEISEQQIERNLPMFAILFEYLVANMDNPHLDKGMLKFLEKLLGISAQEEKKQQEQEEEKEEELDEKEKQKALKIIIYEMYKIITPNQVAGETALENFINNVKTYGVKEAMKHEGSQYASKFNPDDLENLESHRFSFVRAMKDAGLKSGGLGL